MKILPLFLIAALNWSNCTMAYDYTPNPANNPATIRLPNDGDSEAAASVTDPFEDLADKDARKIDGVTGATYTPTGAIIIGGSGLDVQGPFDALGADIGTSGMNCSGTANFFAPVHCFDAAIFDSTIDCAGAATFTGPVGLSGFVSVHSGGTINLESGSSLTVAAGATFIVNPTATFAGVVNLAGSAVNISGNAKLTGTARITYRPILYLSGIADHVNHVDQADIFIVFGLTASRDIQFTNATVGATEVPVIKVRVQGNSGFNAVIKNNAGATIATLQDTGAVGVMVGCELWHDSATNDWILGSWTLNP